MSGEGASAAQSLWRSRLFFSRRAGRLFSIRTLTIRLRYFGNCVDNQSTLQYRYSDPKITNANVRAVDDYVHNPAQIVRRQEPTSSSNYCPGAAFNSRTRLAVCDMHLGTYSTRIQSVENLCDWFHRVIRRSSQLGRRLHSSDLRYSNENAYMTTLIRSQGRQGGWYE
jgi:hypothetical protein